jgi:hypothetical protein
MEHAVLHDRLPSAPWMVPAQRRLPGMQPFRLADWLTHDEAFAGQMALRDRLIAERRGAVHAHVPGAEQAAAETLRTVLAHLPRGYARDGDAVTRPDGVTVDLRAEPALVTAGRLVQDDLCLLERPPGAAEHVLTAAILCFPASWTLSEKIGRPLGAIHGPVAEYTGDIAARVQRLFDALRPDRPLWRQNAMFYAAPDLFHPRTEAEPRIAPAGGRDYLRSERQALIRLPESAAVLFSIRTYVLPRAALSPEQTAALDAHPIHHESQPS